MKAPERCNTSPVARSLLSGLAASGLKLGHESCHQLFTELYKVTGSADVLHQHATALCAANQTARALSLWEEMPASAALQALLFVEKPPGGAVIDQKARLQLIDRALALEPSTCIAYAYRLMTTSRSHPAARHILLTLRPATERPLSRLDRLVVDLTVSHQDIAMQYKRNLIIALREGHRITDDEVVEFSKKIDLSSSGSTIIERDLEIEDYLNSSMPSLKRANFFRSLSERQPDLDNVGKGTSRMARLVILKPNSAQSNNTRPGKKDRRE